MRTFSICLASIAMMASCGSSKSEPVATMKDTFKDEFLIGAAIPVPHVKGLDPGADSIVTLHYNSIVAENCMKCEKIHPEENRYFWDDADAFVNYGTERGMAIIGHTLIWHSQLAPWFVYDQDHNLVSADVLKQRMRDHIFALMSRYKGKIKGWDVVNEAILDNGKYRESPFYTILGEEFIPLAFEYAHEADPDAELYINDYSMFLPAKREAYVKLLRQIKERGLRIDGIGMQSHLGIDYPNLDDYEKSIETFAQEGVSVMITELDMSALPFVTHSANVADNVELREQMNPYTNGLPDDVSARWNERMDSVFAIYRKHADVISRVTLWGTHDGMSWRNDFPMHGRTDYALLFDRNYNLKPFMVNLIANEEK